MKKWRFVALMLVVFLGALSVAGCGDADKNSTQYQEERATESNQQKLAKADPAPQFKESQERKNLTRRLNAWNVPNKISYIYLLGMDGKVVANYTVKGKVSSLESYLTTPQQVVERRIGTVWQGFVVDSPDFDGSYGRNPEGIFFFTTEGAYVEWNGWYMLADQPLKMTTQPILLREIK